jgi:hypothetical protein
MYSIASLIVELQTAKRRLLKVLEGPIGTSTDGLRTRRVPNGRESIGYSTSKTSRLLLKTGTWL